MKETIVKINKTKSYFFEMINETGKPLSQTHQKKRERERERRIKSTKLEIIKERLQQTMQKYKGL